MNLLTIRSHTRFALRQPVQLLCDGASIATGLMIELSAEGCRISGLVGKCPAIDQLVEIVLDDGPVLSGLVRWSNDGVVGLRLYTALTNAELAEVLSRSRGPVNVRRYGS